MTTIILTHFCDTSLSSFPDKSSANSDLSSLSAMSRYQMEVLSSRRIRHFLLRALLGMYVSSVEEYWKVSLISLTLLERNCERTLTFELFPDSSTLLQASYRQLQIKSKWSSDLSSLPDRLRLPKSRMRYLDLPNLSTALPFDVRVVHVDSTYIASERDTPGLA
jgi:hypothetical protein